MSEIITKVARMVETACMADTNQYGYSIWDYGGDLSGR